MNRVVSVTLALLLVSASIACSDSRGTDSPPGVPDPPTRSLSQLTAEEQDAIHAFNKFGWKLFRQIYDESDVNDNIFISPLSISYALGIALNGADGDTRAEIQEVMELNGLELEQVNLVYRELSQMLMTADEDVAFNIANSFWYRNDKAIVPDYVSACNTYFDAPAEGVDFTQSVTVDRINDWVSDKTEGRIEEMAKHPMNPNMASIILNAIYFKAAWTLPFRTASTREEWFYLADGDSVKCQIMRKDHEDDSEDFRHLQNRRPISVYAQPDLFMAANIPYGSEGYIISLFVADTNFWFPNAYDPVTDLTSVVDVMNADSIVTWGKRGSMFYGYEVSLPKLRFSWHARLDDILKSLGMQRVFSSEADFSNMFGDVDGLVNEVRHSSFVQFDEKGTEAAATTIIPHPDGSPPWVRCNRPFLFVIQERESEAILFIGKIGKPVWEE